MRRPALAVTALLLYVLLTGSALADGLLPTIGDVYGEDMPTIRKILMRDPDTTAALPDGSEELTFNNVTETEFDEFSIYLSEFGCALVSYTVEGTVMTAKVEKNGRTFSFTYDYDTGAAVLNYPADTNEEAFDVAAELAAAAYRAQFDEGKKVSFGSYAGEAIEWLVLEANGDNRVLISVKGLEVKPYNAKKTNIAWETCTLRQWLNGEFYNTAFSAEEQTMIQAIHVTADKNPDYSTDPGKDTEDKVYLLSITEVNKYFRSDNERICYPTQHAKSNGVYTNSTGACWWWLRSPGSSSSIAARVRDDGYILMYGSRVDSENGCVRPVVTIQLP